MVKCPKIWMWTKIQGQWVYPPLEEARDIAGLYPIENYVHKRPQTLEDNMAARPVLELLFGGRKALGFSTKALVVDPD